MFICPSVKHASVHARTRLPVPEEGWLLKMIYVCASPAGDLQFYNYISELNQFLIFAFT